MGWSCTTRPRPNRRKKRRKEEAQSSAHQSGIVYCTGWLTWRHNGQHFLYTGASCRGREASLAQAWVLTEGSNKNKERKEKKAQGTDETETQRMKRHGDAHTHDDTKGAGQSHGNDSESYTMIFFASFLLLLLLITTLSVFLTPLLLLQIIHCPPSRQTGRKEESPRCRPFPPAAKSTV